MRSARIAASSCFSVSEVASPATSDHSFLTHPIRQVSAFIVTCLVLAGCKNPAPPRSRSRPSTGDERNEKEHGPVVISAGTDALGPPFFSSPKAPWSALCDTQKHESTPHLSRRFPLRLTHDPLRGCMRLLDLDKIARCQHGVVARNQTTMSSAAWRRAIDAGTLVEIHVDVARLVDTSDTPQQSIVAAVLAAGDGALASHRSAALLHGIPVVDPPPVDIVVPHRGADDHLNACGRTATKLTDVCIHRPRDLQRTKPHRIDEIACTNILRTLVDLGAVDAEAVHGAVGHALTNDLATLGAIETTLEQHARRGRRGVTALRRAVDDWSLDSKPADSVLEPAMRRLLIRYGLPAAEFHASVGGREVDFHVTGTPVVIECDGWTYHGRDRDQLERDRHDDAEFAAHGWIVLRFTYRKITTRPADVANQIRRAVERWATFSVA